MAGVHTKLTAEEEAYIVKKIGPMDKYIPRKIRAVAKAEVKLIQQRAKDKARFTCEIIVHLPQGFVSVHERATTTLAAIDLAEDKLKVQLRKYKGKHAGPQIHRRLVARFVRSKKA